MINYLKSENYRLTHSKGIYLYTAIISGLIILAALTLVNFGHTTNNFPYSRAKYLYGNVISGAIPIMFVASAMNLLVNSRKNRQIIKQSLSFDISKGIIYWSKFLLFLVYFVLLCVICILVTIGMGLTVFNKDMKSLHDFVISICNMAPLVFGALALVHVLNSLKINGIFSMILTLIIYYYSAGLLRLLKYIDKEFIIIYKNSPIHGFKNILEEYLNGMSTFHVEYWFLGIGLSIVILALGRWLVNKVTY
ncbi:hypothetical protein SHJJP8921_001219 [Staphylococcus lugdunensis]|uniref:hypothetical protein n=1 Tax=Staphylococcus lugdunensis TaxID=28035 RepID=UPI001F4C694B|nr:hypothetical protein [Staphylococcus lugdunensis]MCH8646958.1 hypothetical protein [Staphylococcus lugdunensis]